LEDLVSRFLDATGIPFATGVMDKSVLGESHPCYMGSYRGEFSAPDVKAYAEDADLILDFGGLLFDDISTGFSSTHLGREKFISIQPMQVVLGEIGMEIQSYTRSFSPVWIGDVLDGLLSTAEASAPHTSRPSP
jgi:indolepyruvate decarboxylase